MFDRDAFGNIFLHEIGALNGGGCAAVKADRIGGTVMGQTQFTERGAGRLDIGAHRVFSVIGGVEHRHATSRGEEERRPTGPDDARPKAGSVVYIAHEKRLGLMGEEAVIPPSMVNN